MVNLGLGEQDQATRHESGEATGAPADRAWDFQGTLSGPRCPLSPRECPCCTLTPAGHLHHTISSPLPPWESGPRGEGARNRPKLRETSRHLCHVPQTEKIPLFFHPEGVPLYGWMNRGEAPRRWLLSKPGLAGFGTGRWAPHVHRGRPTTSLPWGNMRRP